MLFAGAILLFLPGDWLDFGGLALFAIVYILQKRPQPATQFI